MVGSDFRVVNPDDIVHIDGTDWTVRRHLADGGSSQLFVANDNDGNAAALKFLTDLTEQVTRTRFATEAEIAARHGGKWTPSIWGADMERPFPVIAYQYVTDPTISTLVGGGGRRSKPSALPADLAVTFACDLWEATRFFASIGIAHRDLSAANVTVGPDGTPKILDFGIATVAADDIDTLTKNLPLTPRFASPEQILRNPVGAPADVWGWAAVVLHASTGRTPIPGRTIVELAFNLTSDGFEVDLDGVPDALRDPLRLAFAVEPVDRWDAVDQITLLLPHRATEAALRAQVDQLSRQAQAVGRQPSEVREQLAARRKLAELADKAAREGYEQAADEYAEQIADLKRHIAELEKLRSTERPKAGEPPSSSGRGKPLSPAVLERVRRAHAEAEAGTTGPVPTTRTVSAELFGTPLAAEPATTSQPAVRRQVTTRTKPPEATSKKTFLSAGPYVLAILIAATAVVATARVVNPPTHWLVWWFLAVIVFALAMSSTYTTDSRAQRLVTIAFAGVICSAFVLQAVYALGVAWDTPEAFTYVANHDPLAIVALPTPASAERLDSVDDVEPGDCIYTGKFHYRVRCDWDIHDYRVLATSTHDAADVFSSNGTWLEGLAICSGVDTGMLELAGPSFDGVTALVPVRPFMQIWGTAPTTGPVRVLCTTPDRADT